MALVYLMQPILHVAPIYVASLDFAERLHARRKKYALGPLLAVIHHLEFRSSESDQSGQAPNCDSRMQMRSASARRGV